MIDSRFIAILCTMSIAAFFASRHRKALNKDLGDLNPRVWVKAARKWKRWRWAHLVLGTAFFTSALYLAVTLATITTRAVTQCPLIDPEVHHVAQAVRTFPIALMLMMPVLAIGEEWMFRHVLFKRLICKGMGVAVLVSATTFALFHLLNTGAYAGAFVPPFAAGIVLAFAYRVGGFSMSALTHILYNEVILLIVVL